MMRKEFEINDILNAVHSISKIERKKGKNIEAEKSDLTDNKQAKSDKSEILVLNQMIE